MNNCLDTALSGRYQYYINLDLADVGVLLAGLAKMAEHWQPDLQEAIGEHAGDLHRLLGAVTGWSKT
ncbi:hypothetical protein [Bordetella petrii]|uniref:hypothetical protein n=1 Tax=Bordetella petrii TaxID=94624 RepID=UPI001A967969|nr:hypothetical protein [Bordetella petrii]MBO1114660.1 hypothetical protein [Bordetella petrii]